MEDGGFGYCAINSPSSEAVNVSLDTFELNAEHSIYTTVEFTLFQDVKGTLH